MDFTFILDANLNDYQIKFMYIGNYSLIFSEYQNHSNNNNNDNED